MSEQKPSCPNCNSKWVAEIFWGYPGNYNDEMQKQVERKEIILGGCIVTDHDPKWECNNCHHQWGERDDD